MLMLKQKNPAATAFLKKVEKATDVMMLKLLKEITEIEGDECLVNPEEVSLTVMSAAMYMTGRIMEEADHLSDELAAATTELCVDFTLAAIEKSYPVKIKSVPISEEQFSGIYGADKKVMH